MRFFHRKESDDGGVKVVASTDNEAIPPITSKFPSTLSDIMHKTLHIIVKVAGDKVLGINITRTEMHFFSRKFRVHTLGAPYSVKYLHRKN